MPFAKFKFKPGINKEGTNYSNENGWFDADKIRFRKGRPEKIGGWEKYSSNTFQGTCRKIHVYKDIEQSQYKILGTHKDNYNDTTRKDVTIVTSSKSKKGVKVGCTPGKCIISGGKNKTKKN